MRIYELFHKLIEKFVPMDLVTNAELSKEATEKYGFLNLEWRKKEAMNAAIKKENELNIDNPDYLPARLVPLTIQEKIISFLEQWFMRYVFALLFIYLVPKIQAYINGEGRSDEYEPDDESGDDYDDFKEFQRFKKSMR